MNPSVMRFITVLGILLHFGSAMADEWEKNTRRLAIPGGVKAQQLPDPQHKGAILYAKYCNQCHGLPSPRMHSTDDWPLRFEKMMDHVSLLAGASPEVKIPADTERQEIVSFLKGNGFTGLPANSPLLGEPKAFNATWFCSACHAVPDPRQFPAGEWSKIVERMNIYRRKQGRKEMSKSDRKAVVDFFTEKRQ